jgi:hypothetical protein
VNIQKITIPTVKTIVKIWLNGQMFLYCLLVRIVLMINVLNTRSVGVVCKDRLDFQRWVINQSQNSLRRYFPITNVNEASQSFDELVITTLATANPNYVDIYIKLNGAYNKAKTEPKY